MTAGRSNIQPPWREARSSCPASITDCLADVWGQLLAIADRADRKWPKLAREAVVALSARHEPPSPAERLLADIKEGFGDDEMLFSTELVNRRRAIADAPWAAENINEWTLAQKFQPCDIFPKKMRRGSENKRGYQRRMFTEAWQRWQVA
ncbi:MAG: DUF3631 domain-containing protein [Verrucomicrobia bacterium]|nr:DUF3631 domain-containing protein [Verrucomicrobiota bacterium]